MQERLRWGKLETPLQIPISLKHMHWRSEWRSDGKKTRTQCSKLEMEDKNSIEDSQRVLHFIESTVEAIEEQLQLRPPGKPSITLIRITGLKPHDESGTGEAGWVARDHEVTYSFPVKTKDDAWRFSEELSVP